MKRGLLITIIGTGALLLLLGAGVWWAIQRPTKVVQDAFEGLATAKTEHFTAVVLLENTETTTQLLGEQGQMELRIEGEFERRENERDALAMMISLVSKTESVTVQVQGQMRFIGDEAYLLITKAPQALSPLAQLKNTWLRLPRGGEQTDEVKRSTEQLFTNIKREGKEKIGSATTNKYAATATADAIVSLLDGIADIFGTNLTNEQIAGIQQSLTGVDNIPVELWITPLGHELKQVKTVLAIPGSNTVDFTLTLSDQNKQAAIEAPESSQTIEEVLQAAVAQQQEQ